MAYMLCGEGPYPNKAGEWAANKHESVAGKFYNKYRIGPPAPEAALGHTQEWLVSQGMRGLYLREDVLMPAGATEVPTPPELTEPVADVLMHKWNFTIAPTVGKTVMSLGQCGREIPENETSLTWDDVTCPECRLKEHPSEPVAEGE